MKDEYNIAGLNPRKNPYTSLDWQQITLDIDDSTIDYFKSLAEKALEESTSQVYRMGDEPQWDDAIPWASLKSATATHWHLYGFKVVDLIFKATFTTTTNAAGATVIDKVRTITATGADDNTVVNVDDYSYTFIDSGRTIATTYSCTVGVWDSEDGYYSYFTQDYYVEFYAGGGGTVY